jgi:hypothetical protein
MPINISSFNALWEFAPSEADAGHAAWNGAAARWQAPQCAWGQVSRQAALLMGASLTSSVPIGAVAF